MTTQPVPSVSRADVERIVRRDFPSERATEVFALLDQYGTEVGRGAPDRVHLATLKLAAGSVAHLRLRIEDTQIDYRDVIAGAEYPGYMDRGLAIQDLSSEERQRIIDADWGQYQDWLARR